jgi:hypothetical protein
MRTLIREKRLAALHSAGWFEQSTSIHGRER